MSYSSMLHGASHAQLVAVAATPENIPQIFAVGNSICTLLSTAENRRRAQLNTNLWECRDKPQLLAQNMLHLSRRYGGAANDYYGLALEMLLARMSPNTYNLEERFQEGRFSIPTAMADTIMTSEHGPVWLDSELLERVRGQYYHADACWTCEHCERMYLSNEDDSSTVYVSPMAMHSTEEWCTSCYEDDSFHCEISDNSYASSLFDIVDVYPHGESGCRQFLRPLGYVYSDHTNNWVSPDDWDDAHEDHDSDDDDDENTRGVPDYHCATRRWQQDVFPVFHTPLDRTYGIELEVKFGNSNDRRDFFDHHFRNDGSNTQTCFSAELDGSLCDYTGLEVIGPPIPLREYYNPNGRWAKMCTSLQEFGAQGWPHRHAYGMHVNVDWRPENAPNYYNSSYTEQNAWTAAIERFEAFMLNNRPLCSLVAGRNYVYGTSSSDGGGYRKVASIHEMNNNANGTKYNLVRRRSDLPLVEVRIFGANIRREGMLRNIEFVDSLRQYVMLPDANLFAGAGSAAYRQWLLQPMNAARWSYIAAFLTPIPTINSKNPNVANFAKAQRLAVA